MATPRTPFDSIEGALEYVSLLREAIGKSRRHVDVEADVAAARGARERVDSLRVVAYKLDRLEAHMRAGHALLGDLSAIKRQLVRPRRSRARTP